MAKVKFREWTPRETLTAKQAEAGQTLSDAEKVATMIKIVGEYQRQKLKLTGRQLYYQFVARALIPNTEASYKGLLDVLAKARYAGLVDWDVIEDRGRVATSWREFDGPKSAVESLTYGYRLDRWEGQDTYVELWVEKQALAGVLEDLAWEAHVTLMVNKGYSSASAMYEAARRFIRNGTRAGKDCLLLYLGDHDPSGEDMVRDIDDRLREFRVPAITVRKVALTMAQVEEYEPPPNPAKMSDSRAKGYVEQHGDSSWEVDALPPQVLAELIRAEFAKVIDMEKVEEIKERERIHIEALKEAAEQIEQEGE